jgi:phage tail sheath protein FI
MLTMANPAVKGSAAIRATYPGGAISGLYQRVDAERGVGRAPAGYSYTLQNAYGTEVKFTESEVGTLYNAHINTLKTIPGAGVIVNGARTLIKTDVTKYIPARRTLNYIKATVEELTKPALFQPINDRLFNSLSGGITKVLSTLWSSGALKGNNASEAFYVVCDNTNNNAATIEAGEVHVEVGVALQTPAEFIVINISQFAGGNTVKEIL